MVEGAALEKRYIRKGIRGSNPLASEENSTSPVKFLSRRSAAKSLPPPPPKILNTLAVKKFGKIFTKIKWGDINQIIKLLIIQNYVRTIKGKTTILGKQSGGSSARSSKKRGANGKNQ